MSGHPLSSMIRALIQNNSLETVSGPGGGSMIRYFVEYVYEQFNFYFILRFVIVWFFAVYEIFDSVYCHKKKC